MAERVVFCLRTRMPERFVERALREGLRFEQVERLDERCVRLVVAGQEAARLLNLAEEYQMDLQQEDDPARLNRKRRLRARGSQALGAALCLALVAAFASRVWRIEAASLDGMADEALLREIEASVAGQGVERGMLRSAVDRDALAADIQASRPELTHVGVRLSGVTLRVEVAMEEAAPELYEASAGRDLVAARDAVVVGVEALAGKANVRPGDTVRRGQVLILGEERIDDGQTRGVRALGEVIGRVWFTAECQLPLQAVRLEATGRVSRSSELRLGGFRRRLTQAETFACEQIEERTVPVGGLYLPLTIVHTVHREMIERRVQADESMLRAQGEAQALEMARDKLPETAAETGCWIDFSQNGETLTARATIEATMNIASERSAQADGS